MPTLKQITCSIECGPTKIKLREHQVTWKDGRCSSYVAVPSQHKDFSIHVTSEGYIAPGLAIFVFIDGALQCNRNRIDLIFPEPGTKAEQTEIDFRVDQKEEKFADGKWIARPWTFAGLKIATASIPADVAQHIGTIEIVVLRCYAKEATSSAKSPAEADNNKQGNKKGQKTVVIDQLDGAADYDLQHKPMLTGLDGTSEARYRPASAAPNTTDAPPQQSSKARLPGEDDQAYIARLLSMPSPGQPNNYDYYQTQGQYGQTVPNAAYEAYLRDRMFQQVYQNLAQNGGATNIGAYPGYYPNGWNPQAVPQFQRGPVGFGTYPGFNTQQTGRQPPNSANTSVVGAKPQSDAAKQSDDEDKDDKNTWQNDSGPSNWDDIAGKEGKKDSVEKAAEDGNDTQNAATGGWGDDPQRDDAGAWGDDTNKDTTDPGNKASGDWGDTDEVETADFAAPATSLQSVDAPTTQQKKIRQPIERKKKDRSAENTWSSSAQEHQTPGGSKNADYNFGQHRLQSWQQHIIAAPVLIDGAADAKGHAAHAKSQKSSERYIIAAEPLFQISQSVADKTQASHQVQAGRGAIYEHSTARPKYLDRISKPYAVFTFKYRSRENLANILGVDVGTIKEYQKPMRNNLGKLTKDQLIEQLMRAKARAGYGSDSSLEDSDAEVVVKRDVQAKSNARQMPEKAESTPEKVEPAPKKAESAPQKAEPAPEKLVWDTAKKEPADTMSKMEW